MTHTNAFYRDLDRRASAYPGFHNAHAHIDRFATARPEFYDADTDHKKLEMIRLWDKQTSTALLHKGPAYGSRSLRERMSLFLEESSSLGVTRIDSFVDVSSDIRVDEGLAALNVALDLKRKYQPRIDLKVGAYPVFGFKDSEPERWSLFLEAVQAADFIGTSPERDDYEFYEADRSHIGVRSHFYRTLAAALRYAKPVHYHLDQQINPNESATEKLIQIIDRSPFRDELVQESKSEPLVWAVHAISPTTYDRNRLNKLLDRLAALNIGVIACPSAALSMRRIRIYQAPLNKGIAELLPMLDRGIRVRLGTDNVDDMFLPATTMDMRNEIGCLANALRFYHADILAKIACGSILDDKDKKIIRCFLDDEESFLEQFPT